MITKEEFNQVQDILSGRRNNWTTKQGRDFLFKGIFKCAQCGRSLLGEAKTVTLKSGEVKKIIFYHCSNGFYYVDKDGSPVGKEFVDKKNMIINAVRPILEKFGDEEYKNVYYGKIGDPVVKKRCPGILPFPKEKELEKEILERLDYITNPEAIDELKKQLGESVQEFIDTAKDQMRQIKKRLSEIEGMINRLFERSLQLGSKVTEEDFQTQLERLKNEREELKDQKRELEDENDASVEEAIEFLELSKSIKTKYLASDMATRHKMLKKIYISGFVPPREPDLPHNLFIHFVYNQPFRHYYVEGLIEADAETQRKGYPKSLDFKKWRGRRDSNSRPLA
jgi:hypothetical protein